MHVIFALSVSQPTEIAKELKYYKKCHITHDTSAYKFKKYILILKKLKNIKTKFKPKKWKGEFSK